MATFKIVSRATGKVLDVPDGNPTDGVEIQQFTETAWGTNQQWQLVFIGPDENGPNLDLFQIVSQATRKVLGVPDGNPADGVKIQQFTDNRGVNQQWQLVPVGPAGDPDPHNLFKIVSRATGKVLDVPGSDRADGVKIQQFTDNGGANQQWQLVQVAEPALVGATVSFHTNDEDKDGNTTIIVRDEQNDGVLAASLFDNLGGFPDNSDKGPYCLKINNAGRKSAIKDGRLTIAIDPSGSDTWRFNFTNTLLFSDGSTIDFQVNNVELSQNNPTTSFRLSEQP